MTLQGEEHLLTRGDFVNIPAGVEHSLRAEAQLTRFASMVGPAGIERLAEIAEELAEQQIFPEDPLADGARLQDAAAELDVRFVD